MRARSHVPLVFDDPDKFLRTAAFEEESALRAVVTSREVGNPTQRFLLEVANSAENAGAALAAGMRRGIARRSTMGWYTSGSTRWRR